MIVVTKDKAEKFDGKKPVEASKAKSDILLEAEAVEPEAEAVDEKSDEKKSSKKREK